MRTSLCLCYPGYRHQQVTESVPQLRLLTTILCSEMLGFHRILEVALLAFHFFIWHQTMESVFLEVKVGRHKSV